MEPTQLAEPLSLEDFKALPCILLFTDPDFVEPTHLEVKSLIRLAGLSQSRVAKITGMKVQYHAKQTIPDIEPTIPIPDRFPMRPGACCCCTVASLHLMTN
jgi:hypothetical protein